MLKSKYKIAVDRHIPFIRDVFEPYGVEVAYDECVDPSGADALIIRTRTKCDEKLLKGHNPKIIATATIGYDHIDTQYCKDHGIEVSTAAGCNARAVAHWVFAALISMGIKDPARRTLGIVGVGNVGSIVSEVARSIGFKVLLCDPPRAAQKSNDEFVCLKSNESARLKKETHDAEFVSIEDKNLNDTFASISKKHQNPEFASVEEENNKFVSLEEKNNKFVGLEEENNKFVGLEEENNKFVGLEEKNNKFVGLEEKNNKFVGLEEENNKFVGLEEKNSIDEFVCLEKLLAESDIVTSHVPLNAQTRGMASVDFFRRMRPNAIFLNSSRGEVVDEKALMESGIKQFALDVWCDEPDINAELLSMAQIATPHIAGYSLQGKAMGTAMSVRAVAKSLGITELEDWYPEEVAPTVTNSSITWDELNILLPESYDIMADDRSLRGNSSDFEHLRSNYAFRTEIF